MPHILSLGTFTCARCPHAYFCLILVDVFAKTDTFITLGPFKIRVSDIFKFRTNGTDLKKCRRVKKELVNKCHSSVKDGIIYLLYPNQL